MWPLHLFFSFFIFLGVFFIVFSPNWIRIWVGLELNLFGFIPIIANIKESQTLEASIKYFLIQAFGSGVFLVGSFLRFISLRKWFNLIPLTPNHFAYLFLLLAISIKMGLAPFYFWLPRVIRNLSWTNCILLNTLQKLGPILLFSKFFSFNKIRIIIFSLRALIGGAIGIAQTQIRTIIAYSSIVHLGWILTLGIIRIYSILQYILIYFILSSTIFLYCSSTNIRRLSLKSIKELILIFRFLSIGGLPPIRGFFIKWIGLKLLISQNLFIISFILITSSIFSLFFYLNLLFSAISYFPKKNYITLKKKDILIISISSLGLIFLFYAMIFFYKSQRYWHPLLTFRYMIRINWGRP